MVIVSYNNLYYKKVMNKEYKKRSKKNDTTDTEFYRDVDGGDKHTSDVLKSITG